MKKKITYIVCLLVTKSLLASPVDYDLTIYGVYGTYTHPEYATYNDTYNDIENGVRNNFWWQRYYDFGTNSDRCTNTDCSLNPSTHVGLDFNVNVNDGKVLSYGFGRISSIGDECPNGSRNMGLVRVRNLTQDGEYFYVNLLHNLNIDVNNLSNSYVVKNQFIGEVGNVYGCGTIRDSHLHLEISDSTAPVTDTVQSSSSYPCNNDVGTDPFCTDGEGQNTRNGISRHGLQAHYQEGSAHYYYNPDEFQDVKRELLPFLSRTIQNPSPLLGQFDIYGVANKLIYGSLRINSSTINKVGILTREGHRRSDAIGGVSAEPKYLASNEENFESLTGNKEYIEGDYLFLAYVRDDETDEGRYGYPIVFSFLNDGSFIIDNDKEAYTDLSSYGEVISNNSTVNVVPGYFLTSKLVQVNAASSNDSGEWRLPNNADNSKYKIYAHIPKGATATVTYKIHTVDNPNEGESVDIVQSDFFEEWVELGSSEYNLGANSHISISIADARSHDNNTNKWAAFDAIKFEKIDTTINSVFDGTGSMIAPSVNCFYGCDEDYAIMQPHNNISKSSSVTFQWKKDDKDEDNNKLLCERVVISANKKIGDVIHPVLDLDVNIEKRYWTGEASETYQITLPASINRLDSLTDKKKTYDWDLVSITSVSPLNEKIRINASCKDSTVEPLPAQLSAKSKGSNVNFQDQYVWGGSGSLISVAGGKLQTGKTKDNIKVVTGKKSFSVVQWYKGDTCKKIKISSKNGKNYNSNSIEYSWKDWDGINWNTLNCNGLIPCTINGTGLSNDYYILRLKTGSDLVGLDQIVAECI